MDKAIDRIGKRPLLILCLLLFSCSMQSMEEYREEGREETRRLLMDLEAVTDRKELEEAVPKLRQRFLTMVDIMIEARKFYLSHPDQELIPLTAVDDELNGRLRSELERIYQMPDGRKLIERSQEAALRRLDTFEKKIYSQGK